MLVQLKSRRAAAALRAAFTVLRSLPPVKGRIQRKIMGGMSALGLGYGAGPLAHPAVSPGGVRPGERVARVTAAALATSPGWQEVIAELQRPQWLLLTFGEPPEDRYGPSIRVRTVNTPGPDTLSDPAGHLSTDLGAPEGTWLLIRPDGYLAARGTAKESPSTALTSLGIHPEESRQLTH